MNRLCRLHLVIDEVVSTFDRGGLPRCHAHHSNEAISEFSLHADFIALLGKTLRTTGNGAVRLGGLVIDVYKANANKWTFHRAVSYTHLTLPTIYSV